MAIIILPPLELDPVRKNGVGVEGKVDGVVVISLDEIGTNLRDEVRLLREDSYQYDRLSCIPLVRYARPAQQSLEGLHR